jgi:amino acid permease
MRNKHEFPKALYTQLVAAMVAYTIFGCVTYAFVGPTVEGVALDSAPILFARISYGISSVTIVIGGVVNAFIQARFIGHTWFPTHAHATSWRSHTVWYGTLVAIWILAFLIALMIPSFQHMLGFIGSLFQTPITYGLPALLWFKMKRRDGYFCTKKRTAATIFNTILLLASLALTALGLFAVIQEFKIGNTGAAWSCKANLAVLNSTRP